jgi:hypothetical protein
MREDDGTRVSVKRRVRREVPNGFEGTILINEIVLADYSEVKTRLHRLRHFCAQRVEVALAVVPNVEGISLNRIEL